MELVLAILPKQLRASLRTYSYAPARGQAAERPHCARLGSPLVIWRGAQMLDSLDVTYEGSPERRRSVVVCCDYKREFVGSTQWNGG